MLALKTVLADLDDVPLLVFDEVDANVGGEIGRIVGEKMATIAMNHQVLCVTHLPQSRRAGGVTFPWSPRISRRTARWSRSS
ncbi:MAG: hypothetical protein NVV63_12425 [Opitutus sp.]|nr:hypothetical protein [Opitutus sp.]